MNQLITLAFTYEKFDLIREYYLLQQTKWLTEDLHIVVNNNDFDVELLERVVRFLSELSYFTECSVDFTVEKCDKELIEYVDWFIKFFAYLEGAELNKENRYYFEVDTIEEHEKVFSSKFVPYAFDYDAVRFIEEKIDVEFI